MSSTGFDNSVLVAGNVDFRQVSVNEAQIVADGELLIGATVSPQIRKGALASADASVVIAVGAGTIDLSAGSAVPTIFQTDLGNAIPVLNLLNVLGGTGTNTAGAANNLTINLDAEIAMSYPTDAGTAIPALNILQVTGSHGINTDGATNIVDVQINNAIFLGDLAVLGAGVDALTCTTGDISILSGNLNLPTTADADNGVVEVNSVRFMHSVGTRNTFLGAVTGNFTLSATDVVGIGNGALTSLTSGGSNTCVGSNSGDALQTGNNNTAIGYNSLTSATTSHNTALGSTALALYTLGQATAVGSGALSKNTVSSSVAALGYQSLSDSTAAHNTAMGHNSGGLITSGDSNSAFGSSALLNIRTGTNNVCVGASAGVSLTLADSSNICITNSGTVGDVNTTRIGTQGSGAGQQDTCFMAGIIGVTPSNSTPVAIDSVTGQLGVGSPVVLMDWIDVTGASEAMVVNTGYKANNAGLVTLTLPATAEFGSIIRVAGFGAGGWSIAQNAGQSIIMGSSVSTVGAGGSVSSTHQNDAVAFVCIETDTTWQVLSSIGSLTIV